MCAAGGAETSVIFPDAVTTLVDPVVPVTLRAHIEDDVAGIVEQARDPETRRWTTVPIPAGGYGPQDAAAYLDSVREGWTSGTKRGWAIDLSAGGGPRFGGSIDLRLAGDTTAEVGFGLHPAARGRSAMSSALRLVRDHGFDVLGLRVIRWRAAVGNWASRRVAAAAGFRFDGTIRRLLVHRGELLDAWVATITVDDPRVSRSWADPPLLPGVRVELRPFTEADAPRIVEACSDQRTQHWLASLPSPYRRSDALAYLEAGREDAAQGRGWPWCVADAADGRCLGSISLGGFGGYARRVEIGYWAHPEARGRGLITEAVSVVTEHVEGQGIADSIVIRCAAENRASRHVAEAAGYALAGTLPAAEPLADGSLVDLVTYSRP